MQGYSKLGVLLVLFAGVMSCGESDGASNATNGTQGSTQTASTAASTSSATSASSDSSATTGNGASSDTSSAGGSASTSSATPTVTATSVGGGAGNANGTSASTTNGGGAGGDSGWGCPSEPPVNGGICDGLGLSCAYEDCDGAGRSIAQCTQGTWFVETGACPETVYCNGGSMTCAPGEVCLVMAGGAFLQECMPNTCDGEAVACDCIEGCFGECPAFGTVEMGITITCNTCPSGECP